MSFENIVSAPPSHSTHYKITCFYNNNY